MVRIGILGSGKGSNCRAILEAIRDGRLTSIEPTLVVSDVLEAPILGIAREFSVPNIYLPPGHFRTRLEPAAEKELVAVLKEAGVDLVVLAGYMRVLKEQMLAAYPQRIVNIHPSLLPAFPGLQAWEQALATGAKVTGVTVHHVDAQIDHGAIIAQREVPILADDTATTLHARIQEAEHELYPEALAKIVATLNT